MTTPSDLFFEPINGDPEAHLFWYKCAFRSNYDGDTVRVDIHMGRGIVDHGDNGKGVALRLHGINTPEIKGRGVTPEEKKRGLAARDFVNDLIKERKIMIQSLVADKPGKYGRYLAVIWVELEHDDTSEWINVNKLLLDEGHAVPYMQKKSKKRKTKKKA